MPEMKAAVPYAQPQKKAWRLVVRRRSIKARAARQMGWSGQMPDGAKENTVRMPAMEAMAGYSNAFKRVMGIAYLAFCRETGLRRFRRRFLPKGRSCRMG